MNFTQIHTFFKHVIYFINRIYINIQQFTLFFGRPEKSCLPRVQPHIQNIHTKSKIIHLSTLPIFDLKYKLLLNNHILYKSHHIITHSLDYSLPGILLHISNLFCYGGLHPDLHLDPILILHPLHSCDNREEHG